MRFCRIVARTWGSILAQLLPDSYNPVMGRVVGHGVVNACELRGQMLSHLMLSRLMSGRGSTIDQPTIDEIETN
jgi:hypothetical protein